MTAIIFYSGFIGIYGFIIGKSFKKLNPFLMLLGMFFSVPLIAQVEQNNQPLLYIPFGIGFFANFGNPFRKVFDMIDDIKYSIKDFFATRRNNKQAKKQQRHQQKQQANAYQQNYEDLNRQKEDIEAELNRNKQKAQEEINRQEKQAQERLRREAEELRRQREQFHREQAQARNNQSNQNNQSSSNDDLNPNNFNDACEILGCEPNSDFATLKKAYRYLRSMYHPDKMAQFSGRRTKQAEKEMKLINLAWARVQKEFS